MLGLAFVLRLLSAVAAAQQFAVPSSWMVRVLYTDDVRNLKGIAAMVAEHEQLLHAAGADILSSGRN
jgi:hypothetical protein